MSRRVLLLPPRCRHPVEIVVEDGAVVSHREHVGGGVPRPPRGCGGAPSHGGPGLPS